MAAGLADTQVYCKPIVKIYNPQPMRDCPGPSGQRSVSSDSNGKSDKRRWRTFTPGEISDGAARGRQPFVTHEARCCLCQGSLGHPGDKCLTCNMAFLCDWCYPLHSCQGALPASAVANGGASSSKRRFKFADFMADDEGWEEF